MIMAGLELYGDAASELSDDEIARRIPFKNVFIHGLIRDEKGRKMSKSLGNSPDPLDLIDKYGADALRFGICNIAPSGSDILFSEKRIEIGRHFSNKLWNAARFRRMSGPMEDNSSLQSILERFDRALFDDYDHWILARLIKVSAEIEKCFRQYEPAPLSHLIYNFFWSDFCDWYVEASKGKLRDDKALRSNCLAIQDLALRQLLQLAHPVIPHITEELWKKLGYDGAVPFIQNTRLTTSAELEAALRVDTSAVARVSDLQELISQARALKSQYNLANKRDVAMLYTGESDPGKVIAGNLNLVQTLAGIALQSIESATANNLPAVVTPLGTLYLDLSSSIDIAAEKARLSKELEKLNKLIAVGEGKLKNPKFVEGAPAKIVEGARRQLAEAVTKRDETQRILASL